MADEQNDVLKELEGMWGDELRNAGTNRAPAGNATLKVVNAFVNRSQNGRKQMNWTVEVVEHDSDESAAGSKIPMRFGIENVQDLKRINTALVNLQMEVVKEPKDFLRVMREIMGVHFDGKIVDNKEPEFPPNVYVNAGARRKDLEVNAPKPAAGAADRF
jgi:hypothetical protein